MVGDPVKLTEVAWRQLSELDQLMPYGVFGPVAEYLHRVLAT